MKKQLLLLSAFLFTFLSYSQVANMPTPLEVCDDASSDGIVDFDLTISNAEVLGSQNSNDFAVAYYGTQMDADADMNPLPSPYANTSNPQTVYVRVEELSSGGYDTTTLNLVVEPTPIAYNATLEYCDDDNDGFRTFILTDADIEITQGAPGYTVTYYETMADAQNSVNAVSSPYSNIISSIQTVYARVEDATSTANCASFAALTLIVNTTPTVTLDSEYSFCAGESVIIDSGFDGSTGNYSFDWYMNGIIMTGETGPTLTVVMADFYDLYVIDNNTGCYSGLTSFTVTEVSCVDSDSDGVTDTDEDINGNGNLDDDDTDMDTIPNYLDDDDDGDNVPTIDEIAIASGKTAQHTFVDTDNDLIENYLDDDDDGDGVLTINEDYNTNGDPTDDDTDASGTPDYLEVNVALSTTEFKTIDFAFYPNPATSILNIKLNNALRGNATVEVIDIQGKTVITTTINQILQLDVKSLMSGLYFVKLKYENTQTVKKLIIE
ncbi:T9SS type A sorting domain-containing protein [Lacinutrix mariniflava]|uniref:T9SS type A sorting domain-containing protein n=1 Tax=Lacinutrix mariniflava TaxID=342955 RepID=UPI0006E3DE6B|nr:T9SS type A sorting domain-containing protein [Lacinutrix mariniflava]